MATDKIEIDIVVNGSTQSIKSVEELKKAMADLDAKAKKLDAGSKEFKEATHEAELLKKKYNELSGEAAAKVGNSIGELKKRFKELKVELSNAADPKEFAKLSQELNDVEGQLGDMNDAAMLASGSGFEQLNNGIGYIKEGFANFDFDKIKLGFKGIGNAMSAAIPFLLVEVITLLVQNFDAVVEVAKVLFPALDSVSQSTKNLEKEQTKLIAANKLAINSLENELRVLEASGASQGEIIKKKRELIALKIKELEGDTALQRSKIQDILLNDSLIEQSLKIEASLLRKIGNDQKADEIEKYLLVEKKTRAKEFNDKIIENELALANLKTDLVVAEIENNNKVTEAVTKNIDEQLKKHEEYLAARKAQLEALDQAIQQSHDINRKIQKDEQSEADRIRQEEYDKEYADLQKKLEDKAAAKKAEEDLEKKKDANLKKLGQDSFNASKGLADALFSIQLGNATKGSAHELEIRKRQFQVEKAFSLARIFQDGVRSVQANLALGPYGIPLAIVAGVTAGANFAKVAASKFDGGGGGGTASTGGGGATASAPTNVPNIIGNNTTQLNQNGTVANGDTQRQAAPIQAYVIESQSAATTKRINKLQNQSKIG